LQIGKNSGFSLQRRAVKAEGMDLIHRIKIQRSGSKAGAAAAVDRYITV
jgi:hypothetical protein